MLLEDKLNQLQFMTAMRASIRYIRSVSDRKLKSRSYEYSDVPSITKPKSPQIVRVLQEQLSSFVISVARPTVDCSRV